MFKVILLATFTISSGNDAFVRDHRAFEPFVNEPIANHRSDGLRSPRRHLPSDVTLSEMHTETNSDTHRVIESPFTNPHQNQPHNIRRHPNQRGENPVELIHVLRPKTRNDNVVTYIYINRPKTNSTRVEINTRNKPSGISNNTHKTGFDDGDAGSDFPYNGGNHDLNNSFNEHSSTNHMNTHHTINGSQDDYVETNNNGNNLPKNITQANRTSFNNNRNIHFEDEHQNTGSYNNTNIEHNKTTIKDNTNQNKETKVENNNKYPTKTTQDNEVTPKPDEDEDRWVWPSETTTAVPLVTLDDRGNFGADACPNKQVRLGETCVPRT